MFQTTSIASNAAQASLETVDFLTSNIINSETPGYNGKRYTFRDYMYGGMIEDSGKSWKQGRSIMRVGEPTKMLLRGQGFFTLINPHTNEILYSRMGDFHFDKNGYLETNDGYKVLGIPLQSNIQPQGNADYKKLGPNYEISTFADPFGNPANRQYPQVSPGAEIGRPIAINLTLDPTNGLYLGKYEKLRVDQNGVIWGKYGNSEVSLYKIAVNTFQNLNGLKAHRDFYWKETTNSGPPLPSSAEVFNNRIEGSNVWAKVEIDYIIEAQRQYQAAVNAHKIADRLLQQAIELVG